MQAEDIPITKSNVCGFGEEFVESLSKIFFK